MFSFLDNVPLATVLSIIGSALATIAYFNGDLTIFEALAAWGVVNVGAGQLGVARNGSGRGTK
jgi:hypothetical protein